MIHSMTAFARTESLLPWGRVIWELRSVNHRFLELNLRLPEEWRGLDNMIRERLSRYIQRGKVDVNLRFEAEQGTEVHFKVNTALACQLLAAAETVQNLGFNLAPLSCADVLNWPGILQFPTPDSDTLTTALLSELDATVTQFIAHRQREGAHIHALIMQRCDAIGIETAKVRAVLPAIINAQQVRIRTRLEEIMQQPENERLEQEMVFFAQKMDVSEELERLETHLHEVRSALSQTTPVGRRLDFLMQELNREANTLGAKSVHADTSQVAVNLKVLIEQIREQVQNIE
jgi:uncharacterized protein (TIGR00255 family)